MADATAIDTTTGGEAVDLSQGDPRDTKPEEAVLDEEVDSSQEDTDEESSKTSDSDTETSEKPDVTPTQDKPESTDAFTRSVDPNKLPPELQETYKQMQADYTRKTQDLANIRKSAEAYERFRPYLQKVFADENLTKQIFGGQDQTEQAQVEYPDDPVEFAKAVKAETIKEMRQEYEARERQRMAAEADARDRSEAEKVDPRLNDDPDFGRYIAGQVLQDPDYRSGNVNAVEATRRAVKAFDEYVNKLAQNRNEEMVTKARSASTGVARKTSPNNTVTPSKTLSIREAWREAEAELAKAK